MQDKNQKLVANQFIYLQTENDENEDRGF